MVPSVYTHSTTPCIQHTQILFFWNECAVFSGPSDIFFSIVTPETLHKHTTNHSHVQHSATHPAQTHTHTHINTYQ